MDRRYKPLLPAFRNPDDPRDRPSAGQSEQPTATTKRKRVHVKIACDTCRIKKTACDGHRPSCSSCIRRGSLCTFSGLVAGVDSVAFDSTATSTTSVPAHAGADATHTPNANEIIASLTSAPEHAALDLFHRIRSSGDLNVLTAPFHPEVPTTLDGPYGLGHAIILPPFQPPNQFSVEFELMLCHPVIFPALVPLDSCFRNEESSSSSSYPVFSSPSRPIHVPDGDNTGNHDSTETPVTSIDPTLLQSSSDQVYDGTTEAGLALSNLVSDGVPEPYFCDQRLRNINFAQWTNQEIDNEDAAQAISQYLEVDHPVLGLFDADQCLQDLVTGQGIYCSQLMVNALLAWAYMNTDDQRNRLLAERFFEDGARLSNSPDNVASPVVVAALNLLSLTATFLARGNEGSLFLRRSIDMGIQLGLLTTSQQSPLRIQQRRELRQIAWGLFCYATLHALHCQQDHLESTSPANIPIPLATPGPDGIMTATPRSTNHIGAAFPYLCQLWLLVREIVSKYCGTNGTSTAKESRAFAEKTFDKILSLAESLPIPLARGNGVTHDGTILHIFLHTAVIALLRPLKVIHGDERPSFAALSSSDSSPGAIHTASVNQLRRLMTIYEATQRAHSPSILWHTACLYVANDAIRAPISEPNRREYFDLSIDKYARFYPRFPVTLAIIKGLLAMAIAQDLVTSGEAYEFVTQVLQKKDVHNPLSGTITAACFMIDLDLAMTDRQGAHVDNLVQRFEEITMFDVFTHDVVVADGVIPIN